MGLLPGQGHKAGVLDSKMELLKAGAGNPPPPDVEKAAKYAREQEDLSTEAQKLEQESAGHLERHEKLASSVTLFQIGIAISAIAVLTERRFFWFVGLAFGCGGLIFLLLAYR